MITWPQSCGVMPLAPQENWLWSVSLMLLKNEKTLVRTVPAFDRPRAGRYHRRDVRHAPYMEHRLHLRVSTTTPGTSGGHADAHLLKALPLTQRTFPVARAVV